MDVNGLRSFALSYATGGLQPWRVPQAAGLLPATASGTPPGTGIGTLADAAHTVSVEPALAHRITGVRLASRAEGLVLREDAGSVADVLLQPSLAVDALGNHVRWDGTGIVSTSHLAARHGLLPRAFALPEAARPVTDLTVGDDDVLYLAANGALWLHDLRGRFELARLEAPAGFRLQRLASAPGGGVWALDIEAGALLRMRGLPLQTRPVYIAPIEGAGFGALEPNPDAPHWRAFAGSVPASERALAIAGSRDGPLLVLSLARAAGGAAVRMLLDDGRLSLPIRLAGPRFPHTLGWLDGERIAVATRGRLEPVGAGATRDPGVFSYALPKALRERIAEASSEGARALPEDLAAALQPLGDYHPLAGWTGGPFVAARPGERLHYPRSSDDGAAVPSRVARVSLAARTRHGLVVNAAEDASPDAGVRAAIGLVDVRDPGTVWHRLYAEAAIPPGTALLVWLAAGGDAPPAFDVGAPESRARWHPHLIGEPDALPEAVRAALPSDLPRAAWVKQPTEVAHGQSVLCCEPSPGRAGLFTVLIQRAATAVRALQGARLWVAVELFGDGRATPELAVLRAYAGRVSYRDRYLPALYHERAFGSDAERPGAATGPDFLDRFLNLFEGVFSDIEGRVAASALMTDAMACPADALPWLSSWIGLALEPGMPTERARWMLLNAAPLARRHGTLSGLQLALDIATDGAVTTGRIVVVEDFRLRRTLATILGAQLEDARDPLTAGITNSGNSLLGDSLFLGDAETQGDGRLKSFLALFRNLDADTAKARKRLRADRKAAHRALFDDLSHRVTLLVHEQLGGDELGIVQRLAEQAAPAHVRLRVVKAAYPLMVGVASLVGADTYLRAAPPHRPVRVGPGIETSSLGGVDTLRGEASLDAHAGAFDALVVPAAVPRRPLARIAVEGLPEGNRTGTENPFRLDGSASSADDGRVIESFNWLHRPPS